ncbi:MAG: hypothetical protein LH702_12580 [Phormidesmis sp. CAN_BIN44]|nr:hypothetical protein [Phormidesmis sp. CAN_BIN44]
MSRVQVSFLAFIINRIDENLHSVFTFEFTRDQRIQIMFAIVNPEKLRWVREEV